MQRLKRWWNGRHARRENARRERFVSYALSIVKNCHPRNFTLLWKDGGLLGSVDGPQGTLHRDGFTAKWRFTRTQIGWQGTMRCGEVAADGTIVMFVTYDLRYADAGALYILRRTT